jgi:hypothetical protein
VASFLVGTAGGLHRADGSRLDDRPVTHLARRGDEVWAILADRTVATWQDTAWKEITALAEHRPRCVLPIEGAALVGTSEARLFRVDERTVAPVDSFDGAEGRSDWYTPWGGPPDVRSLSTGPSGIYANVHVGGILRSGNGEAWEPTAIDIDADVHQVLARGDRVLAATAFGLAESTDAGATWEVHADGLHATYCRAVAAGGDWTLLSASRSHTGAQAAVYRWEGRGPLERCLTGLPGWFEDNVDTHCLAAYGAAAALGTRDGRVFLTADGGRTWREHATGLPAVTSLISS